MDMSNVELMIISGSYSLFSASTSCKNYGLAEAFKMAGVKSVLGSIANVDDEATCLLMTEFFKQYLNGKSKHDALQGAQKYVRDFKKEISPSPHIGNQANNLDIGEGSNYYKPYENSRYWASFILLDALN